jgi:hypothetical protein
MRRSNLALVLLLVAARAASADHDETKRLFLAGSQAYDAGRFADAIALFTAAYDAEPKTGLFFNRAQAYRRLFLLDGKQEHLRHAIDDYRAYAISPKAPKRELAIEMLGELTPLVVHTDNDLASAPPPPPRTEVMVVTEAGDAAVALDGGGPAPAPLIAAVAPGVHHARVEAPGYFPGEVKVMAVEGRLVSAEARLVARPGRVAVAGDRGATLVVDGRAVGRLPLAPLETPAGTHQLALTLRGHTPWEGDVDVPRGETVSLQKALGRSPQRRAVRWLLVATGVVACAALAAGAVWAQADSAGSTLDAQRRAHGITTAQLDEYDADRTRRDGWRVGTAVTLGLTGALAVVTGALYLFDNPSPSRKK